MKLHHMFILQFQTWVIVPAVPWNCGAFDSRSNFSLTCRDLGKAFDHKNVPACTQAWHRGKSKSALFLGHGYNAPGKCHVLTSALSRTAGLLISCTNRPVYFTFTNPPDWSRPFGKALTIKKCPCSVGHILGLCKEKSQYPLYFPAPWLQTTGA